MRKIILLVALIFMMIGTASANATYYTDTAIANGIRPLQISLNVSSGSGTNNQTLVYCNGHCNTNFTDIYFTIGTTSLPFWIEDNATGKVWINLTINGTVRMHYGSGNTTSLSNGTTTFPYYNTTLPTATTPTFPINTAIRFRANWTVNGQQIGYGDPLASPRTSFEVATALTPDINGLYNATDLTLNGGGNIPTGFGNYDLIRNGTTSVIWQINGTTTTITSGFSIISLPIRSLGTPGMSWIFLRNFSFPEPSWATWSSETAINYIPIVASDNIKYSNDVVYTDGIATYHKVKEINITENYIGSWRIKFDLQGDSDGGTFGFAKIYKNGVPYGNEQSKLNFGYVTFTQNFSNITILSGDQIQLYTHGTGGFFSEVKNFRVEFDYDYANAIPILLTPTNGSTISFAFPPQFADVNFTWSQIATSGYNIQVAQDAAFSLLVWDVTSTVPYKNLPLDSNTWYWRVRTSNSGITGNWSNTFLFTFSETAPGTTGTNINGVVFEYIGNVQTPVSGASVYLTNSTNTFSTLTGTNGYFLFDGLANGTYSLYSIKQGYDNSQTFQVTTTYNATTTANLPMRIFISPYVPNFVFEKFIIRSLFDDPYSGVTVNIYVNGNLNPSFTGTTDSLGQATFQLIKDTYYRLELSGGGLSGTITKHFYGKEESYLITIATGFPTGGDKNADINATLSIIAINSTWSNLTLYYNDLSNTTSIVNFYAQYYNNGTLACVNQSSAVYPVTLGCAVFKGNNTYIFGWNATSTKYGSMPADYVINFKAQNVSQQIPGLMEKMGASMLNWLSIMILIFVAGLFSAKSVRYGVVIVPAVATLLYWVGIFQVSALIVHSALVIGILIHLRMNESKTVI